MPEIFLIPSTLADDAIETIPNYVLEIVKSCKVIFAENERTARRFLKQLDKNIVIDDFEWFTIHKAEEEQISVFSQKIKENKNIAIISEAGCPGVADPGQKLVRAAHALNAKVKPLVGPSSILLSLMASGMSGQQFEFVGYLPINAMERNKKIKHLETESLKQNCTKIFIETPYRNDQLFQAIISICQENTMLCIAANISSKNEFIKTQNIAYWKKNIPSLHKQQVCFLISG